MVYKRYIKRDGKLCGPYYYESYRDENGKVVSRYLKNYKPPRNYDLLIVLLGVFLILFLLLGVGNASYVLTGHVIEEVEFDVEAVSSEDLEIAEGLADEEVVSDVDLMKEVDVVVNNDLKVIEFEVPEGFIELEFDLLDYGEWVDTSDEDVVDVGAEIEFDESSEKYKWGYDVVLTDLEFMSRIDVSSDVEIVIIDNETLKIGSNYLSFSDLVEEGYVVRVGAGVVLGDGGVVNESEDLNVSVEVNESLEINDTIIIDESNITIEINESVDGVSELNNSEGMNITEETSVIGNDGVEEEVNVSIGEVVEIGINESEESEEIEEEEIEEGEIEEVEVVEGVDVGVVGNVIKGVVGFFIRGITGYVVDGGEVNKVSVYVQRDFGGRGSELGENEKYYEVGDVITLDPLLIRIAGGTATNGTIVYQCGTINESGVYTMNQSIVNNSLSLHCLRILTSNVILNCNGYSISSTSNRAGVYSNSANTTVKNCDIDMGEGYLGFGVFLDGADNSTIFNNTLNNQYSGIDTASSPDNLNISLNNISNTSDTAMGLSGNNHILRDNIVTFNGYLIVGNVGGIDLGGNNNTLINNTINSNNQTGIMIGGDYNVINNNTITYNQRYGIEFDGRPFQNQILNNNLSNNDIAGAFISITSNTELINNTFYSNKQTGLYVDGSNNVTIENNDFWNCSSENDVYSCINVSEINLPYYSNGPNVFLNNKINLTEGRGIYVVDNDNQIFKNTHIYNVVGSNLPIQIDSNSENNSFVNITYDSGDAESVSSGGEFIRKWYFSSYVNDSNGNSIVNADVVFYDINNILRHNVTTNSSGWINNVEISDYIDIGGTKSYYSNYTIYAYNSTHVGNMTFNVTPNNNSLNNVITISEGTFVPPISNVTICRNLDIANTLYNQTANIVQNQNQNCIVITAPNITFDCKGYSITSAFSKTGIYSNQDNTIIKNCNVSMGNSVLGIGIEISLANNVSIMNNTLDSQNYGLQLHLTTNSIIQNNTANSNVGGFFFNGATNNSLLNNIANSNSVGFSIRYGADNNTLVNSTANLNTKGFFLTSSDNNTLVNSTANSNSEYGIRLESCNSNVFENNTVNSNTLDGINIEIGDNNTISNNLISSNSDDGIVIEQGNNNNVSNNQIIDNSDSGILLRTSSTNNYFANNNISDSGNYDVRSRTSSENNTFVNCSYDLSKEEVESGTYLTRKWYYRAYVVDNQSTEMENASVLAYNRTGQLTMNITTNASGWTSIGQIVDYINVGGVRNYYSDYITAANANKTLWDSHNYNVTSSQNNLNDSFIVELDATPPNVSGAVWTSTYSGVWINWTTDEGSNSSVTYWASPPQTTGDDGYVLNHAIQLTELGSNKLYNYYYTSCDFAGNCQDSNTYNFTTAPEPGIIVGGSSGIFTDCISNIQCSLCEGGARFCFDDNSCGGEGYVESCGGEIIESTGIEFESPKSKGAGVGCVPSWSCDEWSRCNAVYNLDEIAENKVLLEGEQTRSCSDGNNCFFDRIERIGCDTKIPIVAKQVEKCFSEFMEIYDLNDTLIARLQLIDGVYEKLNIQMLFDEVGYCPYCYDGEKNFDEDEVDCNYGSEGSCPACSVEYPIRGDYGLWILIGLSGVFVVVVIWYLWLVRKRRRIKSLRSLSKLRVWGRGHHGGRKRRRK
ncbi:hypothetical protein HOD75_02810 [archaeon]|jgi:parallel beta-helix repeat protein|nr:hypothetical protein [archaeon]MBT4241805.1 hypothetical protein [archaeon]MBT4418353.1 hypothetical protein [archaeon]